MGNCCVTPSTSSEKKPKKKSNKPNPFSKDYGSVGAKKLVVLKNPGGHMIRERYDLGRELGRGEFGITYLCTDITSGEKFACKSISKKKLKTAVDIEDVRREVEIMKHMPKHPNIVSLKDTYEDDSAVHIVMELCEGGELFDRIVARGHYTERAAALIMKTTVEIVQVNLQLNHYLLVGIESSLFFVLIFCSIFVGIHFLDYFFYYCGELCVGVVVSLMSFWVSYAI